MRGSNQIKRRMKIGEAMLVAVLLIFLVIIFAIL